MMFAVSRLKASKARLALEDLPGSLDKHPRLHPLNKESSRIQRLLFFGIACLMFGGMILFE